MARARAIACCLFLSLAAACTPQPTTPASPGAPALGVRASARGATPQGPVQVSYFAPEGETAAQVQVSVAFDRPMVALGSQVSADGVLQIEPKLSGKVRWVGSQTLVFEPFAPLPNATTFRVRVAQGLRALDGNTLQRELAFEFSTPEPRVERDEPGDGATRELPSRAFELAFNQPVSPERARELASVVVKTGAQTQPIEFEVTRPRPEDTKSVRISPKASLPLGSQVSLRLKAGLRGEEGPRPMVQDFVTSFEVYGPLGLAAGDPCGQAGRCSPGGGASIRFTNPVSVKDALKHLRFEPALRQPLRAYDEDYVSEYVYISQELAPETEYKVRVVGDLVDAFGNHFTGARTQILRTGPYEPWAAFLGYGDLIQAGTQKTLPLRLSNLAAPKLNLYALEAGDIDALVSGRASQPTRKPVVSALPSVGSKERRRIEVDPAPVLRDGKGVFLATVVDKKHGAEPLARSVLAITDLAPSLKFGARDGLVWLTTLSSTRAVPDAKVRVVDCGKNVASGKTDVQGMFRFKLSKQPECELFAIAEKDGDLSFTHQYGGVGPWDLSSRAGYEPQQDHSAYVFTERGVYRPGETMRVKGVLRAHGKDGLRNVQGKLKLRVADSQDREIHAEELELTEFGTFARSVRIPGSVSLGLVGITLTRGDETFHASAEVAEFRRAELEVEVRGERDELVRGEKAKLKVRGQYLFGAPVAGQSVVWSARRLERSARPSGERYEGYTWQDDTRWFEDVVEPESTALAGGEGTLDGHGELALEVPADMELTAGTAGLEVEATVNGLGGATAAGRAVLTVTPAAFLVGLKPGSTLITPGQKFPVELATAKLDGTPAASVPLTLSLERRTYATELKAGDAGRTEYVHTHKDELVDSCKVTTSKGLARCELAPKAPGLHFLRVKGQDARGRKVGAALALYAYGEGEVSWDENDGPLISLKADRALYQLGERAKVLVASPFEEAEALVTVEREGVLSVEHRHLSGKAQTLEIPVDTRFVPNAFVTVLLVRSAGAGADSTPAYRVGSVEIATDVSAHHLKVDVKPDAEEKKPGENLNVEFMVRDGRGQPVKAELTVFAVDEGVLSLTGYRTPDPFDTLYAPRSLSVWTADARGRLFSPPLGEENKGGESGGGGGEGGITLRKDFDAVAFYAPDVLSDEQGRAKVSFRLPDSLTRFRIMAVAVSKAAEVGAGDGAVRTKKPLMLRPALPRAIRVGDSLEAGAVVHNETAKDLDVELRAEIFGLTLQGERSRRVRVKHGEAQEVRFPLRAERAGEASLRFVAVAGAESDGLEAKRSVVLPNALEVVSTTGSTNERVTEAIAALQGVRTEAGGLEVRTSTTALGELESPARFLIDYPYGCTEQLASRLIGMAALHSLKQRGVLEVEGLDKRVEGTLGELERHQRSDGGFGLWSSEEWQLPPELTAFLTAYALFALEELRGAGFAVAPLVSERASTFLTEYLRGARDGKYAGLDQASVAFVLYALARTGQVDASYAATSFERRAQLDLASKVELAQVFAQAKRPDQTSALLDEVLTRLRVTADEAHLEENLGDDYDVIMSSDVRSTGQLILLLLERDPQHALLPRLARWLSSARELDGSWGTTQESAWGLLALARYVEKLEHGTPNLRASVRLGARTLGEAVLQGRKASQLFQVPMAELPRGGTAVALQKSGEGLLHYTMRLSYSRLELPKQPEERGFFVERLYERIDAAALARGETAGESSERAGTGDYVRVTLRVAVPSARRFVVIEDPLPVGLEPLNFAWLTESRAAAAALGLAQGPLDHSELRDTHVMFAATRLEPGLYQYSYLARASTPGTFVVPPACVEEMYHPETFGCTSSTSFEVRSR
jgi:uncharacterized protein YfaS (alpha-2-macroglobulin family)